MVRTPVIVTVIAALALTAGEASARPKKKKGKQSEPAPASAPLPAPTAPPQPAVPTLASLVSASEDDVKTRLGPPDIARREGASALWTYAWPDCALLVYFKSPDGRTLSVSGASAGPRRRGQATPTVDACLAHNHDRPRDAKDAGAIDALLAPPG